MVLKDSWASAILNVLNILILLLLQPQFSPMHNNSEIFSVLSNDKYPQATDPQALVSYWSIFNGRSFEEWEIFELQKLFT